MDRQRLIELYGDQFHLNPPLQAQPFQFDQSFHVLSTTPAGTNFLLCRLKLLQRQAIVLHTYGVTGAFVFPSLRFVGIEQAEMPPLALDGIFSWSIQADNISLMNSLTINPDGSRYGGLSRLENYEVGKGAIPLVAIVENEVYINGFLHGFNGTISDFIPPDPDGAILKGQLNGYVLPL